MCDYAQVRASGTVDEDIARRALKVFRVDDKGLDKVYVAVLDTIVRKFGGGPVGLSTLVVSVGEEPDTIEDVYEPFLMQIGFMKNTPTRPGCHRGRLHPPRRPPARARAPRSIRRLLTKEPAAGPLEP